MYDSSIHHPASIVITQIRSRRTKKIKRRIGRRTRKI